MDDNEKLTDDNLVVFGGAVKALGNGRVGGYLVRYSSPDQVDLEGDYFDASTDYGDADKTAVYYDHGLDDTLGLKMLGEGAAPLERQDAGVWIEHQLDVRDEYEAAIYRLAEKGKLGWSSGTASHLTKRKKIKDGSYHITRWPLGLDASLTPTPADPWNTAMPLKAWAEATKSARLEVRSQEDAGDSPGASSTSTTAAEGVTVNVTVVNERPTERAAAKSGNSTTEVLTMSEKETAPVTEDAWEEKFESVMAGKMAEIQGALSDQLTEALNRLSNAPALKDAGYVSPDSEDRDHTEAKSFGDFLLAIKNKNTKRLQTVYRPTPAQIKALGEQSGTSGGYLVPSEYEARLMAMAQESAVVRPRATVMPVGTNSGELPALDQTVAPTAGKGQSGFTGGVRAYWTKEAGTLTSTDPLFTMIEYNINKIAGYTKVSNEMVADSAITVETLLSKLFGMAVAAVEDYAFLRGTGAGEPLGILAAPCTIAITTNTDNQFMTEDCMAMLARFWPTPGSSNILWILQRALIPDLYVYHTVAVAGMDAIQPTQGLPTQLLGYPIVFSEHMPAANTDDAILADLSAYLIFDRQGMQIAYSDDYAFITDEATWRFTKRLDGQPWLKGPIYLADPGGATTVSPFLYHDD